MTVSIIITSYNHEQFIAQAIESFLNQSFQDFELIIIDDASTDSSVSVIKGFSDKRIKTIFLEKNVGFCRAANIALEKAGGEYIKIFASDDVARSDILEKQVKFLQENTKYDAVFSKMSVIDESGRILERKTKRFDKYFLCDEFSGASLLNHFFFRGNCLAAPTFIVKKDAILKVGGFDERMIQAHDFDLWVRLCLKGCKFFILPERLVSYRRIANDGNMSANTEIVRKRLVFDNEKILGKFLQIKNVDFLVEIFPNLALQKDKITPDLIPFFLAQEALKVDSIHHKQFALSTIFDILEDATKVKKLECDFGFSINKDFARLVGENQLGTLSIILDQKPLYRRFFKVLKRKFTIFIKEMTGKI